MQPPRIRHVPEYSKSAGDDATALAAAAGLHLDPWQQLVLRDALGERENGKWTSPQVGLLVARQNGKSALLEARALAGLFLFDEALILYSAHHFKTAKQVFLRLKSMVEGSPTLMSRVKKIYTGAGGESIELNNGNRLMFIARSRASGRGFSVDTLLLDEAQELTDLELASMLPTMSARPNSQVWYTGTVPGPEDMNCQVWTNVRDKGRSGDDAYLAWLEWSAGEDIGDLSDRARWAEANPALGLRVTNEFIESNEYGVLPDDSFARERLSIWPSGSNAGIFGSAWDECLQADSTITGPVSLGVAVSLHREYGAICAAGRNAEGRIHLEVVEYRRGMSWLADRVAELSRTHNASVVIDGRGPASSLIATLDSMGVRVTTAATSDAVTAAANIYDLVQNEGIAHLGHLDLDAAVLGARKRDVGDRWAFGRKTSIADISPLEAASLAAWGANTSADYDVLQSIW
ncbi:terminase large subunit [Nocardioides sp. WS12]|uniref:terminase large subunit n=1 Tax=Nocardioides sp. WS12 TaxID=2486272 RepID=UPI0015FA6204|nr:terminase large subunit [Nocardioides sp. WS12]